MAIRIGNTNAFNTNRLIDFNLNIQYWPPFRKKYIIKTTLCFSQ